MKLKKLLAFGLALVMCLAMAACGTNPDEKTDAEPVSITVTENWDFSVGFYVHSFIPECSAFVEFLV